MDYVVIAPRKFIGSGEDVPFVNEEPVKTFNLEEDKSEDYQIPECVC